MAWFSKSRPGQAGADEPEPETVRLRSLALGNLFSELVPGGAYRFLDMGPALGSNIEFLSPWALSVQVGDFYETLTQAGPPSDRSLEKALGALTPNGADRGYHVVLAWDLLNYLDRPRLVRTAHHLGAVTRPGGFVFAIVYYAREMPAEPLRYRIAARDTLTHGRPAGTRSAPRYPQAVIEQAFADFKLERAYLLKSGSMEFLFARKAPALPELEEPAQSGGEAGEPG